MTRRFPLVATLMVLIAVPVMIALGFWQLDRMAWKRDLLAELATAPSLPPLDLDAEGVAPANFRRAAISCRALGTPELVAGRSPQGRTGYSYRIPCFGTQSDHIVILDLGWAPRPGVVERVGLRGRHEGLLVDRAREEGMGAARFLLIPPRAALAPLEPSAPPALDTIANSHQAYAVQWFGFAAVLLAVYLLFLRGWLKRRRAGESVERVAPPAGQG